MQEETAPLPIPAPPPLVHNERVKLTAAAIDRLSTALMVVGVLGQALSLTPATASVSQGLNVLSWFSGALVLHLIARRVLGRLKS